MSLENLVKVNGHSFEDVRKILVDNNVRHGVDKEPRRADPSYSLASKYFRSSIMRVNQQGFNEVIRLIDGIQEIDNCYGYFAEYNVLSGFDYKQLDGTITFRNGNLVEWTQIVMNPYF